MEKSLALPPRPKYGKLTLNTTNVDTNYYPITFKIKEKSAFLYDVKFDPEIPQDSTRLRRRICQSCAQITTHLGQVFFKNTQLIAFTSKVLPTLATQFNGQKYKIFLTQTREISLGNLSQKKSPEEKTQIVMIINMIMKVILGKLKMVQMGRTKKSFRESDQWKDKVPNSKLNVWPGYSITCHYVNQKLILNIDSCTRVLRNQTALDKLRELGNKEDCWDFVQNRKFITSYGKTVFYSVDEIDYSKTPQSTFFSNGQKVKFKDYYKKKYDIAIRDLKQPLFKVIKKVRQPDRSFKQQQIFLVPELLNPTGMTDYQRKNGNLMKDLAKYTKLTPAQKMDLNNSIIQSFNKENKLIQVSRENLRPKGYLMDYPYIQAPKGKKLEIKNGKFMLNGAAYNKLNLKFFTVVYVSKGNADDDAADDLVSMLKKAGPRLGIQFGKPGFVAVKDPKYYKDDIEDDIKKYGQSDMYIVILKRSEDYPNWKKFFDCTKGLNSQFVLSKTITHKNIMSICSKILIQISYKMGIPAVKVNTDVKGKIMYIGMSFSHRLQQKSSCASRIGVVACDSDGQKFFIKDIAIKPGQNMYKEIATFVHETLPRYLKEVGTLPDNIIFYRSALGIGDYTPLLHTQTMPILRLLQNLREVVKVDTYKPRLAYFICNLKISQRIFSGKDNPESGTVAVQGMNLFEFDFFMVPQCVQQGTATPVHYVCLFNNTDFTMDQFLRFTFAKCFNYGNWTGAVRVPDVVQMANKLCTKATKVLKDMRMHENLATKLSML